MRHSVTRIGNFVIAFFVVVQIVQKFDNMIYIDEPAFDPQVFFDDPRGNIGEFAGFIPDVSARCVIRDDLRFAAARVFEAN